MNILVLYFTQSGQLLDILNQVVSDIKGEVNIDYAEIKMVKPFPFPWKSASFFDVMPESVLQIPAAIQPMPEILKKDYDLVLLGYQPWFLHPSIPINSFLKSEWAIALKNKPVITIIGCRNMWLNAQEKVKADLNLIGANLVGNIVLEDKHPNMISTLTIIRWLFTGQKEASKRLPAAGVSDLDIQQTKKYGKPILQYIQQNKLSDLQPFLVSQGAVNLVPGLIVLEKRGISQFPKWAAKAKGKGAPGNPERMKVIKTFQQLLVTAIFVLSPITSLIAKIQTAIKMKKLLHEVEYFKGVSFEQGRL